MNIEEFLRQKFKESIHQQFHIEGDIWLVPCVANYIENEFKPLSRPIAPSISKESQNNKQGWTTMEDEILLKIVSSRGPKCWSSIAKELNIMIHEGSKIRQGRHCRERWFNHVDPDLVKGNWTEEEDEHLIKLHQTFGNKWSEISKQMRGRTENSVKNRFKSISKKKGLNDEPEDKPNIIKSEVQAKIPADCLLLMSPQIVNFDIGQMLEMSPVEFILPRPVEIRPISHRLPAFKQITETKESLRREVLPDGTPSPSIFLR